MNNTNLIVEKNNVKVQKENKQTNEKHTTEQAVKLYISNEGMEYYRNCIQQNRQETYDDVLQRRELLKSEKIRDIDYGYEISKKAAELNKDAANAGQNALSTTDRANGYVAAYAELYDEIVQGYESGTREIYVTDENGTHKLTRTVLPEGRPVSPVPSEYRSHGPDSVSHPPASSGRWLFCA